VADRDLGVLLSSMAAHCDGLEWVFCKVDALPSGVEPAVIVREDEGITVVVTRPQADELGLAYDYVAARLTLRVHSALDAVGLTAAVSGALASAGISANVVAGFFHDHVYVPFVRRDEALAVLSSLSSQAARAPR
jgi:hypothetical protein